MASLTLRIIPAMHDVGAGRNISFHRGMRKDVQRQNEHAHAGGLTPYLAYLVALRPLCVHVRQNRQWFKVKPFGDLNGGFVGEEAKASAVLRYQLRLDLQFLRDAVVRPLMTLFE
ncbi:MAG: hypothetical protein CSB44_03675 [Gammaproteobacteria bacterium]|nr:MAG: hypothetical protein CSB44_03675 [Gammaproteobacteria bacterium]